MLYKLTNALEASQCSRSVPMLIKIWWLAMYYIWFKNVNGYYIKLIVSKNTCQLFERFVQLLHRNLYTKIATRLLAIRPQMESHERSTHHVSIIWQTVTEWVVIFPNSIVRTQNWTLSAIIFWRNSKFDVKLKILHFHRFRSFIRSFIRMQMHLKAKMTFSELF